MCLFPKKENTFVGAITKEKTVEKKQSIKMVSLFQSLSQEMEYKKSQVMKLDVESNSNQ